MDALCIGAAAAAVSAIAAFAVQRHRLRLASIHGRSRRGLREVVVRRGGKGAWRWFAIDAAGVTRASCLPRRFQSAGLASADVRALFPDAPVRIGEGAR